MTSVSARMANDLLIDEEVLLEIASSSKSRYRRIELPSGRTVWKPSPHLSLMQYWIIDWLSELDQQALPFAAAYERGCSVLSHARRHAENDHILAMDIRRFFPSIDKSKLRGYLGSQLVGCTRLDPKDLKFICEVVMFDKGLVMGAPSSPFLANRVMRPIDDRINREIALRESFVYTRYSDDIFLSSHDWIESSVAREVEGILADAGFAINSSKTRFLGPGDARRITGVVINQQHEVSLGQKRKRELRKRLYDFSLDPNPTRSAAERLLGFLGFCEQVEPEYVGRMLLKYQRYGGDVMQKMHRTLRV